MYDFKPVSERIYTIREKIRNRVIRVDSERASLITEFYRSNPALPPQIMRAEALKYLCKNKTLRVENDELIVGNLAQSFCGASSFPEWGEYTSWILGDISSGKWALENDGAYHTPPDAGVHVCIFPHDVDKLIDVRNYWTSDKVICASEKAWQPDCFAELYGTDATNYREGGVEIGSLPYGHIVPGFERLLKKGYGGIKSEAKVWLAEHGKRLMGSNTEKYLFYKSAISAAEAGGILCSRYAHICQDAAEHASNEDRKSELMKMADGLANIAENRPRNYWEALQAVMIYMLLIKTEANHPGVALGRFDQYTWPFLKADLEAGKISMVQAQELTDAFFLKVNGFYTPGAAPVLVSTGVGNTYQHTTIGGCNPDAGFDASNPVTYMVLETISRLKLHDPTISLRVTPDMPEELWKLAVETSCLVGGLPLFENDEAIIKSLVNAADMELHDARDYGIVGCQEAVGSGCEQAACGGTHPNHSGVHAGKILATALNNGCNPYNEYQCGMRTGFLYEMKDMDEVRTAFRKLFVYIHDMFISVQNYSDYLASWNCPSPALSIFVDGCMENGRDICAGGAKYNRNGGAVTGFATVADSFAAINYLCFDKCICSTKELYDAIMSNWEGHEELRQIVLNEAPRFGNGDMQADAEFKWCAEMYADVCGGSSSARARIYSGGMIGAADHICQGWRTWATPDGRCTGDALADAASPGQGRTKNGPTAIFRSLLCFDHSAFPQNIALNIRIHPSVLKSGDGWEKLKDMTQTYFRCGGMEVQYNIVDTALLREAQKYPEAHKDLVVRIAGYSAYFVELDRALQDDIISRSEITL